MPSLYELTESTRAAIEELLALEDVPQEAVNNTIEGLEGELQIKQRNVAAYILNRESDIEAMKQYKNNMEKRIKQAENQINRLKNGLLWSLKKHGKNRLELPEMVIKIKNNPLSVAINNMDLIPPEHRRTKVEYVPDKKKIKESILAGKSVSGAHLETKERIDIK